MIVKEGDEEDEIPLWLRGREHLEDELENLYEPGYLAKSMYRGQNRGKASMFSKTTLKNIMLTCKLKTIFKMQVKQQEGETMTPEEMQIVKRQRAEFERDFKKFITPKK